MRNSKNYFGSGPYCTFIGIQQEGIFIAQLQYSCYIPCSTKSSLYNVPGSPLVLIIKCGECTLLDLAGEIVDILGDGDTHRDSNRL